MKRLRPALLLGLLSLASLLHAATTPAGRTEDLGQVLTYVLPTTDKADGLALFKAAPVGPTVLDLRYFSSGAHASVWIEAIKTLANPRHVCLVLVSPEMSPELAAGLSAGISNCITIGRISPSLKTDIAVSTTAENDRKAWESIRKGADLGKLITVVLDKPRYDEAVLAKEHAAEINGTDSAPSGDAAYTDDASADTPKKEVPPSPPPKPLVDAVLQRAVQIDQGLVALRKL